MPRVTLLSLIQSPAMGYCCEFAFFSKHKRTAMIALRLGISDRAVRYRKALYNEGKLKCLNFDKCLKARLTKGAHNA